MESRKIQFYVKKDELSNSEWLYIRLNNKEIVIGSFDDGFGGKAWELTEMGMKMLFKLAMSDKEYTKYLQEQPERINQMAEEMKRNGEWDEE